MEGFVAQRLVQLCQAKRISFSDLSKLSGVTRGTISQIVHGKVLPSLPTLRYLCEGMNMTVGEFFSAQQPTVYTAKDKQVVHLFRRMGINEQAVLMDVLERAQRGRSPY